MAMSLDRGRVEKAVEDMALASKRLRGAIIVALALFLAVVVALFVQLLLGPGLAFGLASQPALRVLSLTFTIAIGLAIFGLVASMMADTVTQSAPFTMAHSKRLFLIGVLFAACAVLEIATSVGIALSVGYDFSATIVFAEGHLKGIYTDVLLIFAAIVSFYLSYTFRYGSFLQWLYDETV